MEKKIHGRFFVLLVVTWTMIAISSCNSRKDLLTTQVYDGPIKEMDNIMTKMSDSLKIVVILTAPKLLQYESGDETYPEGIFLQYFDDHKLVCTFEANKVHFTSETGLYKGEGDVVVRNVENGDEMNTEELFWDPAEEQFYTERFVTIKSEGEIHTGEGLTANQDFTSYEIHKPAGTITVDESF